MFLNCFSKLELKKNLCPSRVQKRRTTSGVKYLFNDQKKMQTALPSSSSSVCFFFFFFFFLPCWLVSFKSIYGSTRASDALALACAEK
jgi:hypothetical protein